MFSFFFSPEVCSASKLQDDHHEPDRSREGEETPWIESEEDLFSDEEWLPDKEDCESSGTENETSNLDEEIRRFIDTDENMVIPESSCSSPVIPIINSLMQSPSCSQTDPQVNVASLDAELSVMNHSNTDVRKWDKKYACLYCGQLYSKLARHLEQMHGDESEVAMALAL